MTIIPWPSRHVGKVWNRALPLLQKAIDMNDGYLPNDVFEAILAEHMQLFIVANEDSEVVGAIVTTLIVYPRKKSCFVLFLGGTGMRQWKDEAAASISAWARSVGCSDIEALGRPGLEKYFPAEPVGIRLYRRTLGGH